MARHGLLDFDGLIVDGFDSWSLNQYSITSEQQMFSVSLTTMVAPAWQHYCTRSTQNIRLQRKIRLLGIPKRNSITMNFIPFPYSKVEPEEAGRATPHLDGSFTVFSVEYRSHGSS
jgi:hypothetical protein